VAKREITNVLARFASEASKGAKGDVSVVCRPCENDKTFGFIPNRLVARQFVSSGQEIVELTDSRASLVWTVLVTQTDAREKRKPDPRQYDVTLERDTRGWIITLIRLKLR
jgi:hypothetical protein